MKLPDYSKCINLNNLLSEMGIKEILLFDIHPIEFIKTEVHTTVHEFPNPQIEFAQQVKTNPVPLHSSQFNICEDGTIEVNGVKCCIYIKNQRKGIDLHNRTSEYRYHLTDCRTIQQMRENGRYSRYVATSREDGFFIVNNQMYNKATEKVLKLELCQNCIEILRSTNKYDNPFSLKNYYNKYQSKFNPTVKKEEQVHLKTQYAPNHDELSKRYKEEAKYTCQQCGVHCKEAQYLLHLHHKDGDGQNNSHTNLKVVCVDCHSKQPMHSQILANAKFKENIREINLLRQKQNLHII